VYCTIQAPPFFNSVSFTSHGRGPASRPSNLCGNWQAQLILESGVLPHDLGMRSPEERMREEMDRMRLLWRSRERRYLAAYGPRIGPPPDSMIAPPAPQLFSGHAPHKDGTYKRELEPSFSVVFPHWTGISYETEVLPLTPPGVPRKPGDPADVAARRPWGQGVLFVSPATSVKGVWAPASGLASAVRRGHRQSTLPPRGRAFGGHPAARLAPGQWR
jgi:hypothetical protein